MATPAKIIIDLKKQTEVADLVATLEPGDTIILETTIQAKDDQTLTLSLVSATTAEGEEAAEEPEKGEGNPTDLAETDDSQMGMGMDTKPSKAKKGGLPADL